MYVYVTMFHGSCVEVGGQLSGVSRLLSPSGFQGLIVSQARGPQVWGGRRRRVPKTHWPV